MELPVTPAPEKSAFTDRSPCSTMSAVREKRMGKNVPSIDMPTA